MKKLIFLLLFIPIFLSCKKNKTVDAPAPEKADIENKLNLNSYIVDTIALAKVTDNSVILLKSNTNLRPKVGDILLANPTTSNPYGLLRKVISVAESPLEITCNTKQANLIEAFEQLTIDETYSNGFSSNKIMSTGTKLGAVNNGGNKASSIMSLDDKGTQLSLQFIDNNTLAPGIKLNGELVFNIPSVQIQYKRLKGSLAPEKVLIKADFNTDGSTLEITKTDDASVLIAEKKVIEFNLPLIRIPIPVPTPVGIIIIQIPFSEKLVIKTLPLSISGKVKWTTLPKISATLGAKYENMAWSNLSTYTIDASAMPLSKLDFSPDISATASITFLTAEYEITPYVVSSLKAFFSIPNELDLTIQPFSSPNYSLQYKLDVKGGLKQEFYTGVDQEYSITGNFITKTILEGNWLETINIVTGSISSITQTSAAAAGNIVNDGGKTITARGICWNTSQNPTINNSHADNGSGTGTFAVNITGLTANTTYYARAYVNTSTGTFYGNEVSFITSDPNNNLSTKILGKWRYTKYTTDTDLKIINNPFEGTDYIDIRSDGKLYHRFINGTIETFNWSISGNTLKIINEDTDSDMQIITLTDTDLKVNTNGLDNLGKVHLVSFFFTKQS